MLTKNPSQDRISQIGLGMQEGITTRPTTERVIKAFKDEAIYGIGTYNADMLANEAEGQGTPITLKQWENSPYYDRDITYYPTMTIEGAVAHKEMVDFSKKNAEIINRATTGQTALGFAAAFGAGMVEPKNLMVGVAASAVLSPVGGAGVTGVKSAKRLLQINRTMGRYGPIAARGFGEGLVAAALMEPSNRSSAKKLQQEYTLADSLWNVGLSSVLGAGLATAPSLVRDKMSRHKGRAADIIAEEIDLATAQMAEGRKVDVEIIEQTALQKVLGRRFTEEGESNRKVSQFIDDNANYIKTLEGGAELVEINTKARNLVAEVAELRAQQARAMAEVDRPEVEFLDPGTAERISQLKDELNSEISKKRRSEVEREIEMLESGIEFPEAAQNVVRAIKETEAKRARTAQIKEKKIKKKLDRAMNQLNAEFRSLQDVQRTVVQSVQKNMLEKVEAAQKSDSSIAIDSEGVKVTERRLREMPEAINYQEQFKADSERIKIMVDEGIIPERVYNEYLEALDNYNDADIQKSLKILENCLLRG